MGSAEYPLAPSYREAARLNLQHYNWKQTNGFLIHPRALPAVRDAKIADIGTGTAIWLLDLSESLPPSVQLDGFDIDLSQAPPREWLPPNVSLEKLDIHGEIPSELVGKYDLINVRFFVVVVQDGDPLPLMSKLRRMLKPGGFLQWTEMDRKDLHIESVSPPSTLPATQALFDKLKAPTPNFTESAQSWVSRLKQKFEEASFLEVHEERKQRKPWQEAPYHDVTLLAVDEMAAKLADPSGARELVQKAAQEYAEQRRGISISGDAVTVIGRH